MDNLQQIHGSNSTQSPSTGLELVNAFNANFEKVKNEIESLDQRLFYEVQITSMQELNVLQSGTYKIYFTQNSKTEEFYLLCSVDPETSAVTQTKISDKISSRKYEDSAWSEWGSSDTEVQTLKASLNSINADVAHLYKTRTEINISVEAPTSGKCADGSDGGDLYDLSLAISVLPGLLAQVGGGEVDEVTFIIGGKLTYFDKDNSGKPVTYVYLGGTITEDSSWEKSGGDLDKATQVKIKDAISKSIFTNIGFFRPDGTDGTTDTYRYSDYIDVTDVAKIRIHTLVSVVTSVSPAVFFDKDDNYISGYSAEVATESTYEIDVPANAVSFITSCHTDALNIFWCDFYKAAQVLDFSPVNIPDLHANVVLLTWQEKD